MNVLTDPVFTVERGGSLCQVSLPEVFACLVTDEIDSFPEIGGLHYEAWHQFLVQLGAIATDRPLPTEAEVWRERLLSQAPRHAWVLEHDNHDEPAFLQPDAGKASANASEEVEYKVAGDPVLGSTPLVNYVLTMGTKNHSVKRGRTSSLTPEQEIYLVLFIQTNGRYGGPGHDSPTRSNGSRPFFTVTETLRPGPWITGEIEHLRSIADEITDLYQFESKVSPLLWTVSWSESPLSFTDLHPLYIDCARQLRRIDGVWHNVDYRQNERRVENISGSATGDYWAPVDGSDTLKTKDRTFQYRDLRQVLFGSTVQLPASFDKDIDEGWIICSGVVSGTRGSQSTNYTSFCQRQLKFSNSTYDADAVAEESRRRYEAASDAERILDWMLDEAGVDENRKSWSDELHDSIDAVFFERLFELAGEPVDERREWDDHLRRILTDLRLDLRKHVKAQTSSSVRSWRRRARLETACKAGLRSEFSHLFES